MLWDFLSDGRCLRMLEGHGDRVTSVAMSADGRIGISGSRDQTVRLWDLSDGRCLRILEGHGGRVTSVAMSVDGRIGISGSHDETVRLWDLSDGRCLRTFEGHGGGVTSVAMSADGRIALSGSVDKSVRLWKAKKSSLPICAPFELSKPIAGSDGHDAASEYRRVVEEAHRAIEQADWVRAAHRLRRGPIAARHIRGVGKPYVFGPASTCTSQEGGSLSGWKRPRSSAKTAR